MAQPIWQPSAELIANSNMLQFMHYVNNNCKKKFISYAELYAWSVNDIEQFWQAVWDFCQIKSKASCNQVLVNPNKMPGAQWFVGAKLNFAENLLRFNDHKSALIFCNEKGTRRELSYRQLNKEVTRLAHALKKAGINANDRVVAFMPNMPETVIAMLATTALGAIWSSCSPDFGVNGIYDRFGQIAPKLLFTADGYYYGGKVFDSLEKIKILQQKIPSIEKVIVIPYINDVPDIGLMNNAYLYDEFASPHLDTNGITDLYYYAAFDHPVYIMYSSGTTGAPKCIVHGAGGTLIQHLKELVLHSNLTRDKTIFYYTTCGWMMWNWYISSLAVGATLIQYDGSPFFPETKAIFDLIDSENINIFGTGAKYIASAEKAGLVPMQTHSLQSLDTILSTGSPLLPVNYDYVYNKIKKDVCLSSISGGTDIISCFALGNPIAPVYKGELQCRGLGMKVEVYNDQGQSVIKEKGELVCTATFPSMPIYFWNDEDGKKYQKAYFEKFPNIWAHGDYAEITEHDGLIIYGRSDAVLNPGGIRIGTAEIYRQVEKFNDILESIVIDQEWQNDTRIILFVKLRDNIQLTEDLKKQIKNLIKGNASPHHVPAKIIQVADIPRTISGKIVELAVRNVVHGKEVKNIDALANPEALAYFENISELAE